MIIHVMHFIFLPTGPVAIRSLCGSFINDLMSAEIVTEPDVSDCPKTVDMFMFMCKCVLG